jgi:hypothetical protein
VPGYLHWVPPAFVQPFHEKLRRRVDYGGQAGTIFGNKINPQIIRNGGAFSALLIYLFSILLFLERFLDRNVLD